MWTLNSKTGQGRADNEGGDPPPDRGGAEGIQTAKTPVNGLVVPDLQAADAEDNPAEGMAAKALKVSTDQGGGKVIEVRLANVADVLSPGEPDPQMPMRIRTNETTGREEIREFQTNPSRSKTGKSLRILLAKF